MERKKLKKNTWMSYHCLSSICSHLPCLTPQSHLDMTHEHTHTDTHTHTTCSHSLEQCVHCVVHTLLQHTHQAKPFSSHHLQPHQHLQLPLSATWRTWSYIQSSPLHVELTNGHLPVYLWHDNVAVCYWSDSNTTTATLSCHREQGVFDDEAC